MSIVQAVGQIFYIHSFIYLQRSNSWEAVQLGAVEHGF